MTSFVTVKNDHGIYKFQVCCSPILKVCKRFKKLTFLSYSEIKNCYQDLVTRCQFSWWVLLCLFVFNMVSLDYCLNQSTYISREFKYKEDCKTHLFSVKLYLRTCVRHITILCFGVGGRLCIWDLEYKFCSQNQTFLIV